LGALLLFFVSAQQTDVNMLFPSTTTSSWTRTVLSGEVVSEVS